MRLDPATSLHRETFCQADQSTMLATAPTRTSGHRGDGRGKQRLREHQRVRQTQGRLAQGTHDGVGNTVAQTRLDEAASQEVGDGDQPPSVARFEGKGGARLRMKHPRWVPYDGYLHNMVRKGVAWRGEGTGRAPPQTTGGAVRCCDFGICTQSPRVRSRCPTLRSKGCGAMLRRITGPGHMLAMPAITLESAGQV